MEKRSRPVPPHLVVATAVAGIEASLLAIMGVLEVSTFDATRAAMGTTTAIFFFGYAAALAWCAFRLSRLDSWARSPVVLAQLIQLGVAWSFRGGATTWVAIGLALLAGVVLVGIFHPRSIEALADEP